MVLRSGIVAANPTNALSVPQGWNVLPLGCGGLTTGFDIAPDGTVVVRSDVGNCYRFSGTISQFTDPSKRWIPLMTYGSLGSGYAPAGATANGGYELIIAPTKTDRFGAILPNDNGAYSTYAFYLSNNSGDAWTKTSVVMGLPGGGSNGPWRRSTRKAAFDPNNEDVIYVGTGVSAARVTAKIDNGSGGSGTILTVTAIDTFGASKLFTGQTVYNGTTAVATITGQSTGTVGGIGTYGLDTAANIASQSFTLSYAPAANTSCIYRSIDGSTFSDIPSLGVASSGPGGCGIIFDKNYGTVMVGPQLRTKRVIVPVGGVGIYESLDGGVTFTETAVAAMGSSDISVAKIQMDFDGVCYAIVVFGGNVGAGNAHLWRYSGPGGTWVKLNGLSGAPSAAYFDGSASAMFVDPRDGHQGFISVYGANGIGIGYTSTNANAASASSVTWGGGTGGQQSTLAAPDYDCPWLNSVHNDGTGSFVDAADSIIDQDGNCWWCGNQGAMWLFMASDLVTPVIPNYAVSNITYAVSTSRGTEITVAQDAIDAPGAPHPVIAAQDVGIFQTSFKPRDGYPTDFYPSPERVDCETLEYAASDPSFYVGKVNREIAVVPIGGGAFSAYSSNYGAVGSWVPYAVQPDLLWCARIVGSVSAGVLTVESFTAGTGLGNVALVGQAAFPSSAAYPSYGTITGQLSGSAGGVGTYSVTGSASVASGTALVLAPATVGGQMVAVDADHHMCCITHNSGSFVPAYTANARSASNTWQFCNGLPSADWMLRGYNYGQTSRPFAVGYGTDLGTVWAVSTNAGTATLYRSTDSGANFASIATFSISINATAIYVLSVPGFPNELWVSGYFTGGTGSATWHITNANTASPTVTPKANPAGQALSYCLTMGAPATPGGYPALYLICNQRYGAQKFLYQGDYNAGTDTLTWTLFAHPNGNSSDLPPVCQVAGYLSIRGSWNAYQRLMVASGQSGFAFYNP